MQQEKLVSKYCKLCGRELEGTEKVTGVCVRCKSLGNRQGAQDVQEAFDLALKRFFPARKQLMTPGPGWVAFYVTLIMVAVIGVLYFVTRDIEFAVKYVAVIAFPLELIIGVLALFSICRFRTNPTLAILAVVANGAGIAWVLKNAREIWVGLGAENLDAVSRLSGTIHLLLK